MKMTYIIITLIALLIVALLSSCISIKTIEYRTVDNFEISKMSANPEFKFDVKLFNPNGIGARVKALDMEVFVDGKRMAGVSFDETVKIKANSEFIVPITGETSLIDLVKLIPTGLGSLLGNKTIPINIKGEVTIKKFIFRKKLKFDILEDFSKDKIKT